MSYWIQGLYLISAAMVFSQFGGKLTARNSLTWFMVYGLMGVAVFAPAVLAPFAALMGVQVVSNGIFAALILFLSYQAIQESAFTTRLYRKFRELNASMGLAQLTVEQRAKLNQGGQKTLVVIPAFNESTNLPALVAELNRELEAGLSDVVDVCLIDDGSSDSSKEVFERLAKHSSIICLNLPSNGGVSNVLLTGFKLAHKMGYADFAQLDADGQHPVGELRKLIQARRAAHADLVIGSRFVEDVQDESTTPLRRLGSLLIQCTLRLFSPGFSVKDPTSGFRVYSKVAIELFSRAIPDEYPEPEAIAVLLVKGKKVTEIPVKMRPRAGGVSTLAGLKGPKFMIKVLSALWGLRLRTWMTNRETL
jgi:hypothetical protein